MTKTIAEPVFIAFADAQHKYDLSKTYLRLLVAEGKLDVYRVAGSRKLWVREADMQSLFEKVQVGMPDAGKDT